jgi:hypothetical protein
MSDTTKRWTDRDIAQLRAAFDAPDGDARDVDGYRLTIERLETEIARLRAILGRERELDKRRQPPSRVERVRYLECPCCGEEGAEADKDGMFTDGQPLICGCDGNVTCDNENEPEINAYDCVCRRGIDARRETEQP